MAKYCAKDDVEVEAEQFRGFYTTPYPPGVEMRDNSNDPRPGEERYHFFCRGIYDTERPVRSGDFVVFLPGGGYYPVPADVFRMIFNELTE